MKKLILLSLAASVAACQAEPEPAPAPESEEAAPEAAVANGSGPGTYEVTAADGSKMTAQINADGTYTDTAPDGTVVEEGTWAVTDGKTCFTPTTEGVEPMCYTESAPGEDGSFTATPDKGDPVTVKPKATEAAAPAAAE
jgi:hypothetical protein